MAKKTRTISTTLPEDRKEHISRLIDWMSSGVYEKEQIIAIALLAAVAGENMFLLGPPGTAKSMVASRLKMVFKGGKSFDYLMSRFSTPDEIFGPVSISRLKNEDKYERLTEGYLPEADIVFLDEIWKAGPSIQNTLLTVINEHVFFNGGRRIKTPMKVLIAASNELPAKDEGLEALWDRFLMRMVSNCIESDTSFFKMMTSAGEDLEPLPESLYITAAIYETWQAESARVVMHSSVVAAIKALRRQLSALEKEDGGELRYYVSDRRWRKAYRLMQTSAYLNGRNEINLTDFLLLIHSFWNDVEAIPKVLEAFTESIANSMVKSIEKIEKSIRQIMSPGSLATKKASSSPASAQTEFAEFDYFYYLVENYPDGNTYFSKWDYTSLTFTPRDGVKYFDNKRKRTIIHSLIAGRPFETKQQNASGLTKVKLQKCHNGVMIDGVPYSFRRRGGASAAQPVEVVAVPDKQRVTELRDAFQSAVAQWEESVAANWTNCENIFLSSADLALVSKKVKEVSEMIKTMEVKLNNIAMMFK